MGKKQVTWRLFDDKDISVNDQLQILDKTEPDRPDTWRVIGTAIVNQVDQKRLKDLTSGEMEELEIDSHENLLKLSRGYYAEPSSDDTPVKIVHFSFLGSDAPAAKAEAVTHVNEAKVFADGGSRGNPGPSASGYVVLDMQDVVLVKGGVYLGITTNNQAEYQALMFGLEAAAKLGVRTVHVYMDSLLVINQMKGIFKVKNRDLWPIHESIITFAKTFESVKYTHVPRELNKLADAEVNETLDAKKGGS